MKQFNNNNSSGALAGCVMDDAECEPTAASVHHRLSDMEAPFVPSIVKHKRFSDFEKPHIVKHAVLEP